MNTKDFPHQREAHAMSWIARIISSLVAAAWLLIMLDILLCEMVVGCVTLTWETGFLVFLMVMILWGLTFMIIAYATSHPYEIVSMLATGAPFMIAGGLFLVMGSLFAARLHGGGHEVALLARGQRLADLREHGIVLVDTQTGEESVARPRFVERLDPEDAYDLVLVIMRKNRALEILPTLAVNHHTPNILFLMNNAAGPGELVKALGQARVLMGFPMAAGYRRGYVVFYMVGAETGQNAHIPIGEVDGQITPRLQVVGRILASMPGFDAELRRDMDAWLKTHVALLMPSLAPAMRAASRDNVRMAHTRDLIVLTIRAIREGFHVLRALGIPITPIRTLILFGWMPEPILVWGFQKRLVDPRVRVAMLEHAEAAQDEIKHLAGEFLALKRHTSVPTPAMDRLSAYFDPETPRMPERMAEIPLDWRGVWAAAGVLAGMVGIMWLLYYMLKKR